MSDNKTTKERGEQWAIAQREKLRQSTINKAEQLLQVYRQHIAWLEAHSTTESLIEIRRPLKRVREETEPEDEIQLVQSSRHCTAAESSSRLQRSLTMSRSGQQQQQQQHRSLLSTHLKARSSSNSSVLSATTKQKSKETPASTTATTTPSQDPLPPRPGSPEEGDNSDEEQPQEVDPDFILSDVPSWAKSPELVTALARQSTISGDQVFGPIKPVATSDVFGRRRIVHRI